MAEKEDWFGCAESLRDHLRCPIFSRIRSLRRTSSHPCSLRE